MEFYLLQLASDKCDKFLTPEIATALRGVEKKQQNEGHWHTSKISFFCLYVALLGLDMISSWVLPLVLLLLKYGSSATYNKEMVTITRTETKPYFLPFFCLSFLRGHMHALDPLVYMLLQAVGS